MGKSIYQDEDNLKALTKYFVDWAATREDKVLLMHLKHVLAARAWLNNYFTGITPKAEKTLNFINIYYKKQSK